jgi:hypothetical protein
MCHGCGNMTPCLLLIRVCVSLCVHVCMCVCPVLHIHLRIDRAWAISLQCFLSTPLILTSYSLTLFAALTTPVKSLQYSSTHDSQSLPSPLLSLVSFLLLFSPISSPFPSLLPSPLLYSCFSSPSSSPIHHSPLLPSPSSLFPSPLHRYSGGDASGPDQYYFPGSPSGSLLQGVDSLVDYMIEKSASPPDK